MSERKSSLPVGLDVVVLSLVAFTAPVAGGQVSLTAMPIQDGFLQEALGGAALPLTGRLLLTLPLIGLLGFVLARRRVLQFPPLVAVGGWTAVCLLLLIGGMATPFLQSATQQWWNWPAYLVAMLVVVAVAGRRAGVTWVLGSVAAGVSLVGLKGVLEYASMAAREPGYRIAADWNNPNAAATILLMGLPLTWALGSRGPRWTLPLAGVAGGVSLAAIWFTASKGGLLALAFAVFVFLVSAVASKSGQRAGMAVLVGSVVAGLVVVGLRVPVKANAQVKLSHLPVAQVSASRVFAADKQSDQSVGFRKNLWRTSVEIARRHPFGVGAGNFRSYSGEPGLVDQTVFAHQTWLQLAAEGGLLCLVAALVALAAWIKPVLARDGEMPPEARVLRAGVLASVAGAAAHGMVESNLYTFGAGLTFFVLMGCGAQLTATGSQPWPLRFGHRLSGLAVLLVLLLGSASSAATEMAKASALADLKSGDRSRVVAAAAALEAGAPEDAEALYLRGLHAAHSLDDRVALFKKSSALAPTTKTLRALASSQIESQKYDDALATLAEAKKLGRDNPRTVQLEMKTLLAAGRAPEALATARRLVAIEDTPLFKIRSLDEVVPTETLQARKLLADSETDPVAKVKWLRPAAEAYMAYRAITYHRAKALAAMGAGEGSLAEGKAVIKEGLEACRALQAAAQSAGNSEALAISTRGLSELSAD